MEAEMLRTPPFRNFAGTQSSIKERGFWHPTEEVEGRTIENVDDG